MVPAAVRWIAKFGVLALLAPAPASAAEGSDVQARIDADLAAGQPVVVHVVVALCDNANQGIVPVPAALGNGQDPKTNLYWGALYGVRTHLTRSAGWKMLSSGRPRGERPILDRVVMHADVERNGKPVPVYVVADAWDGAAIRDAMQSYLEMSAGKAVETITLEGSEKVSLRSGGAAHVVVYIGHNGRFEFELDTPAPAAGAAVRSAIALACASKPYLADTLRAAGAHPLLLTTGLMAPEAYTLDAALRAWISKGTAKAVLEGAAGAYHRYQQCGLTAARRLFWARP